MDDDTGFAQRAGHDLMDDLSPIVSQASIDRWLAAAGFAFNPFAFLDAGADPRIVTYLVGHGAFAAMWGHWPGIAYAPPGGGKTALRVLVTQACWSGPDRGYPLPITYLPIASAGQLPSTLEEHLSIILKSMALSLLEALRRRPHWWYGLGEEARRQTRGLLDMDLPFSLEHHLAETEDSFANLSEASSHQEDTETRLQLSRWLDVLQQLTVTPADIVPLAPGRRLKIFTDLALRDLNLAALYLLVDGIDGYPETADDARAGLALLDPLVAAVEEWSNKGIYLKGFFPTELSALLPYSDASAHALHTTSVVWSPQLLAEVLRQRVYVATAGRFGSLDALSAPGLRDVEARIARAVRPLPREGLVLVSALIWEHLRRSSTIAPLDEDDLQAAIQWYRGGDVLGGSSSYASR